MKGLRLLSGASAVLLPLLILSAARLPVAAQLPPNPFQPGDSAPPFEVTSLSGDLLSLEALEGRVVVLNFWFIACPPCIREMPDLNRVVRHFQGKEVNFVSFSPDSTGELEEFLKRREFLYEVVPDATPIAELYGVGGAPTHILIDRSGKFHKFSYGAVSDLERDLIQPIERLLQRDQ